MNINIIPIPILKDNYVWTILNKEKHEVFIVDPGDSEPVLKFLQQNNLKPSGILITHHHWDHTNGVHTLKNNFDVPVYGSYQSQIPEITNFLREGDSLTIFNLTFKIIETPGHTLDHICYYSPGILFCGDTLFGAGCGRLFEGTAEQMFHSLQKINSLPADTKIYCTHEYTLLNLQFAKTVEPNNPKIKERIDAVTEIRRQNKVSLPSTLVEEQETNPFLRCHSAEIIHHVEKYSSVQLNDPVTVFKYLRLWKDQF